MKIEFEGVLPVWKPVGYTSHDVVAKARRILGMKRIGHTGTLDPQVTGVLPLCLGRATRLVEYIQELPKEYEATLVIGVATDTEDMTGQVVDRSGEVRLDPRQVEECIASFVGDIMQTPPMYSAVKVQGKRLYELARQGETVQREARKVTIHTIEMISMRLDLPNPEISIRASCSKGTYIRTLCADIGKALGYPAAMAQLVRTVSGGFTRSGCVPLEDLEREAGRVGSQQAAEPFIVSSDQAISFLPDIRVDAEQALRAMQGKQLTLPIGQASVVPDLPLPGNMIDLKRIYAPDGKFLGLFRLQKEQSVLIPEKVFATI